jgi:hypothetical protein
MDIKNQLIENVSKFTVQNIVNYINNDIKLFGELMKLIFNEEHPIPLRASWVASIISDNHPELLYPYIPRLIEQLRNFKHSGVRRNFLRYLSNIEVPEPFIGQLFDDCYHWLLSKEEPPAVRVYSMQIIFNISRNEPDLLRELSLVLEELSNNESAGIRSRIQKLLKKIRY